ncbi:MULTISPECIES: AAA family ATPase [Nonomuraea]|uniref:AAA family ATPase n=1 Tax=Nonomuraea mangrovi TaxID=2316207 RepID=A0ABW4SLU5_9ACTN
MALDQRHVATIQQLGTIVRELDGRYVGRRDAARLLVVAAVCREHMLLLGPPGTAKTDLVGHFAGLIQARSFTYLLTRFTEPSELFGPLDFERFQKGVYRVKTDDMLPAAEIAFLDEVFQGSSAILNTLLSVVNERYFFNGASRERVPLVSLFGASSELPEDPALRAFGDRFLLRMEVEQVARTMMPELLKRGWQQERERVARDGAAEPAIPPIRLQDLLALSGKLAEVDLGPVRDAYAEVITDVLAQGVTLSDRRIVRGQKLVAAAALLRQSLVARPVDLWPVAHIWTEPGDAGALREAVGDRVVADGGQSTAGGRTVAELEALARHHAMAVLGKAGAPTQAGVIVAMRGINEVHRQLRADHRGEPAAQQRVHALLAEVAALLDDPQGDGHV